MDDRGDVYSGGRQRVGNVDQMVVVKHSGASGTEQWRYTIGIDPSDRAGVSLARSSRGAIFASSRDEEEQAGPYLSHVVKLAAGDGSELWRTELPGAGIRAVAVDPSGDLLAAGGLRGAGGVASENLLVVKLAGRTGAELWRHELNGDAGDVDSAFDVAVDGGGDVLVAGEISANAALGHPDFAVLKLSGGSGSGIWKAIVPSVSGQGGRALSVAVDRIGDVAAGGLAFLDPDDSCDIVVAKFSGGSGGELWRASIAHSGCDVVNSIALDPRGHVLAAASLGPTLFSAMKFSSAKGEVLWRHDVPNLGSCSGGPCAGASAVEAHASGDAMLAGIIVGTNGDAEAVAARLSAADGSERWLRVIDHDRCDDGAHVLATDASGDLAIGGTSFARIDGACAAPAGGRYTIRKLSGTSGEDYRERLASCSDGADNDGDGLTDHPADPGCDGADDTSERSPRLACDNGLDDDGDGPVDLDDPDCKAPKDPLEGPDADGDGVADDEDNCTAVANRPRGGVGGGAAVQADTDGDGHGDACDGDFNNDGVVDDADAVLFGLDLSVGAPSPGSGTDMNSDGVVNSSDAMLFRRQLEAGEPGP
jgi:hypothetical protein